MLEPQTGIVLENMKNNKVYNLPVAATIKYTMAFHRRVVLNFPEIPSSDLDLEPMATYIYPFWNTGISE